MPKNAPAQNPLLAFDKKALGEHFALIGVDEAGRGALAGPVVAACVWVFGESMQDPAFTEQAGLFGDSKQLSGKQRGEAMQAIEMLSERGFLRYSWAQASVFEIEKTNILRATATAMDRSVAKLIPQVTQMEPIRFACPDIELFSMPNGQAQTVSILVDGSPLRHFSHPHRNVVKGDSQSLAIGMASIVAKEQRDRIMEQLAPEYPGYGFEQHKGYGTQTHRDALQALGPSPIHRELFLRKILEPRLAETQQELLEL